MKREKMPKFEKSKIEGILEKAEHRNVVVPIKDIDGGIISEREGKILIYLWKKVGLQVVNREEWTEAVEKDNDGKEVSRFKRDFKEFPGGKVVFIRRETDFPNGDKLIAERKCDEKGRAISEKETRNGVVICQKEYRYNKEGNAVDFIETSFDAKTGGEVHRFHRWITQEAGINGYREENFYGGEKEAGPKKIFIPDYESVPTGGGADIKI